MREWRHLCIGRLLHSGRATRRAKQTSDGGLLLRHAVQRAQYKDEISTTNAYYGSTGKRLGDDVERDAVVGVVEHWHQHKAIRDVEVGVACRKALPIEIDRGGHGELDDAQGLAGLVGGFFLPSKVFRQGVGFWVGLVRFR